MTAQISKPTAYPQVVIQQIAVLAQGVVEVRMQRQ